MAGRLLLGLDAGNTKTIALVAREDGTILGAGRGGCGDIYGAESAQAALQEIETAACQALEAAGVSAGDLAAGGFSLAGADWPEDHVFLHEEMWRRGLGRVITVVNDAIGALRAGSAGGPAVGIACGTGLAIGCRDAEGRYWNASWWLESHGAAAMSRTVLRAVYRAELGIEPETALSSRVLRYFGLSSVEEVLHLMTHREGGKVDITGLVGPLLDEAGRGDATARRLVDEHARGIAEYALAAARRAGIERDAFTLVLAGGVLRHSCDLLTETLLGYVRQQAPLVRPVRSPFEPSVGALFLAFDSLDIPVGPDVQDRLKASLPDRAVFATERLSCPPEP
jgi:N-acetylglucosamine kinase-like BadF-type ATPase